MEWLVILAVTVIIATMGFDAFSAGKGHEWLLNQLPLWLAFATMIVIGFFQRRVKGGAKYSFAFRRRPNFWIYVYYALWAAAALLVKFFLPPQGEIIYLAGYWWLASITILALLGFGFFASPTHSSEYMHPIGAITGLLVLTSTASAPAFMLLWNRQDGNASALAVAGVLLVAPMLYCTKRGLSPFKTTNAPDA